MRAVIVIALLVAGCSQPKDPRVDDLANRVAALEGGADNMTYTDLNTTDDLAPSEPIYRQYDLVVDWPGNNPPEHHVYPSQTDCEEARATILRSNAQRRAAATQSLEEQDRQNEANGVRVVAVANGGPALPTPLCVPS